MATEDKEYVKLPGRGSAGGWTSFFGLTRTSCTLWLAKDHLLQTELASGYVETGKRFYFRDIQALILIKNKRWQMSSALLAVLTVMIFLLALTITAPFVRVVALFVGGIFALIFLINLAGGPTCACHLKTAVHQEELPSLRRLRRARKILNQLQPLIEQAQGTVSREEVAARFQSILQELNLTEPVAIGQTPGYVAVVKPYRSRMHGLLYGLLLLDAVVSVLHIYLPSTLVIILAMLIQLGVLGSLILALVKQDETDLKPALKSLTWVVGVYVAINYIIGYVIMLATVTTHPTENTQWAYIKALAAMKPRELLWLLWLLVGSAVISFGLGAWGNLLLAKHWRDQQKTPAVADAGPPLPPKL